MPSMRDGAGRCLLKTDYIFRSVFCNVVFLIFKIPTTFQPAIIKKLLNSNLTCATGFWRRL